MALRTFFLCVPSCPLWFKLLYAINHKGHEDATLEFMPNLPEVLQ
jgi:hypothetical protein